MKAIITGMNGTLAPYISSEFEAEGWQVYTWHRSEVAIDDLDAIEKFISNIEPDLFLHIATGPVEWLERIIKVLKPLMIPLMFTSTESVFDESQAGPFTIESIPRPRHDYGKYKLACENIINRDYIENSYIVRLGWQIALHTHKNNMLAYLVTEGLVEASTTWVPSVSFMPDTAEALVKLVKLYPPDLYHLDGNTENWNFYQLAKALKEAFLLPINVEKKDSLARNNRLINEPIIIQPINIRIQELIRSHDTIHP